ncbi:MAG: hypothetical protein Q8835_02570, partial [Sweet potato little leaf phytoplasma]|nr:hypothetical protein [Sweet potato little leaf phytoplasma]
LCINSDGSMNELAEQYKGLDRFVCRERLISDLDKKNLLFKIEKPSNLSFLEQTTANRLQESITRVKRKRERKSFCLIPLVALPLIKMGKFIVERQSYS